MKKQIVCFLVATIITAMMPTGAIASNYTDKPMVWSKAAIEAAVSNGLLKGDNGEIMPNSFLTRSQMATILNRSFGTVEKASLSNFIDVPSDAWYYDEMAKAVHMQTFIGSGNQLKPDIFITREEAFTALARAFKLTDANGLALNGFTDMDMVSSWARDGISALVSSGYVSGYDGKLNPKQNITRAEFAQIMNNLVNTYIQKTDTYSRDIKGNVMVNVSGVVLKNMTITGNLIIGDGVGNGDVTLENVMVTGTTIVRGGGIHSIRIMGNSNLKSIVVVRVDGEVRVFAENGTQVGTVIVDGRDDVIVEGSLETLIINSPNVTVTVTNANIKSATISGDNSSILVNEKSEIGGILIQSNHITVSGTGKVGIVKANGSYITVTTPQTTVIAGQASNNVFAGTVQVAPNKKETTQSSKSNSTSGTKHSSRIQITAANITGYYSAGSVLTANVTPAAATVLYQWQKSDTFDGIYEDMSGETSKSINLTSSELGKYIKVKVAGTGNYSSTVSSNPSQAIVLARIEATTISHAYIGEEFTGTFNTVRLFDTKFKDASICEDLSNWTVDTGTTNLTVSSITRNSDQTATINYSLKAAGQGTGTGSISIKVKAAAVETNLDTNVVDINIVAPTYSIALGTITREAGDTQSAILFNFSAAEGEHVTLTVIPKAGIKIKDSTLKVYYNDGILKEVVLSGSGPYTFIMPAYPVTINAEFEYIYYNVHFGSIGSTSNGWGTAGDHGSAGVPGKSIYFIGITTSSSGYFKVYDIVGSQPGVSGSNPATQAYFLISTFSNNFTIKQFSVYNPNDSAVPIKIKGLEGYSWAPPTDDGCIERIAVANSWTTIDLTGVAGFQDKTTVIIDFPDNTSLYFNDFVIRP